MELVRSALIGSVVAPAGCGKTQLIRDALATETSKPYLVLTHTTAGVSALKKRLRGIPAHHYHVTTIAGWSLTIARSFPVLTGYRPPDNDPPNYPALLQAVGNLCANGNLADAIQASYSRIFVDEYQDCDIPQHHIVCSLSRFVPTIVFGDPMQTVFDFGGPLPNWENEVLRTFPLIGELNIPWRWLNARSDDLGAWLLNVRETLYQGNQIDLRTCLNHVTWYQLTDNHQVNQRNQVSAQYNIRQSMLAGETLLVIGDPINVNSRHEFARSANGLGVVERVDLNDVVNAAGNFDRLCGNDLLNEILMTATDMMTGVERAALLARVDTILNNRHRTPPTIVENAAVSIIRDGSNAAVYELLLALELKQGTRVFRPDAFRALRDSVEITIGSTDKTIQEASVIIREQRRYRGDKRIPSLAIGSTLLLKGLEADHVLILDAGAMNAKHLYVALTRGAKTVTVFSRSPFVG